MAEVPPCDTFTLIDLAFMEFRFGAWASPQFYGTAPFAVQLVPFCHRTVFDTMGRLPPGFRRGQRLPDVLIAQRWPELASVPFQRYMGLRHVADAGRTALRRARRRLTARIVPSRP